MYKKVDIDFKIPVELKDAINALVEDINNNNDRCPTNKDVVVACKDFCRPGDKTKEFSDFMRERTSQRQAI